MAQENLVDKLTRLHLENPVNEYPSNFWTALMQKNLALVKANPPRETSLQYLANYGDKSGALASLVQHLPEAVVAKEFGDDLLFWAWQECASCEGREMIGSILATRGYCQEILRKLHLSLWQDSSVADSLATMRLYSIDTQLPAITAQFDPSALAKYARQDQPHHPSVEKFSLVPLGTEDYPRGPDKAWYRKAHRGVGVNIQLDVPSGLALCYEQVPQAIVGFTLADRNSLFIKQLQGVQHYKLENGEFPAELRTAERIHSRGIQSFRWPAFFIEYCASIAADYELENIRVQSAKNNKWTKPALVAQVFRDPKDAAAHVMPVARLERIYDESARSLGFSQGADGNWQAPISKLLKCDSAYR